MAEEATKIPPSASENIHNPTLLAQSLVRLRPSCHRTSRPPLREKAIPSDIMDVSCFSFPLDVERIVMETAARQDMQIALQLAVVAKRVQAW